MAGYQQPGGFGQQYAENSQATMVLILGILGLVVCQLCSPVAWIMGSRELQAIDAGRRPPTDRQLANIGRILGIVGTIFGLVVLMFFLTFFLQVFASLA